LVIDLADTFANLDDHVSTISTDGQTVSDDIAGYMQTGVDDIDNDLVSLVDSSMRSLYKTVSKNVDKKMQLGLKDLVNQAKASVKESRDYLAKTIKKDIKVAEKDIKKKFKTELKNIKKILTARNLGYDSIYAEVAYETVESFVDDFSSHFYDNLNDNLFNELPYSDLISTYSREAAVQRSDAKTLMKQDETAIRSNFQVASDAAGPTLPTEFDIWTTIAAGSVVEAVLTRNSDNVASTCGIEEIPKVDGCEFGPLDDLKYKSLCEMGGGSFSYGTQVYDCETTSWPSSLFCEAASTTFLN